MLWGALEASWAEPSSATYTFRTIPAVRVRFEESLKINFRFQHGNQGDMGDIFTGKPSNTATWDTSFSMHGKTEADITEHGAGKVLAQVRVMNAHDGSYLSKNIGEAYMRLHFFVWASVAGPYIYSSLYYNSCEIYPYCFTGGKDIIALTNLGFFQKPIFSPSSDIYTNIAVLVHESGSAYEGGVSFDGGQSWSSRSGASIYVLKGGNYGDDETSETMRRINLRKSFTTSSHPYVLRDVDELHSVLGNDTYFHRADPYTLYYDPTGNAKTYSLSDKNTDKLFVVHLGGRHAIMNHLHPYFFDPRNGF